MGDFFLSFFGVLWEILEKNGSGIARSIVKLKTGDDI